MKFLLISGSRNYAHYRVVYDALRRERGEVRIVFQGGARGADTHAKNSAILLRVPYRQVDAEWRRFGPTAGNLRNAKMLEVAREALAAAGEPTDTLELWAFKEKLWEGDSVTGGNGTLDMVTQALRAGVAVRWYRRSLEWVPLVWEGGEVRRANGKV